MIDSAVTHGYPKPISPHWESGFGRPFHLGARAMRRKSYGFFHALTSMVGGIWEALWLAGPKSGRPTRISSIARCLVASVDGYSSYLGVLS